MTQAEQMQIDSAMHPFKGEIVDPRVCSRCTEIYHGRHECPFLLDDRFSISDNMIEDEGNKVLKRKHDGLNESMTWGELFQINDPKKFNSLMERMTENLTNNFHPCYPNKFIYDRK
jgi:hypothetical protein